MTTVNSRKQHGAARRVEREHDSVSRLQTVVQRLPVARDDEQRVVDPHADADHRRDRCGELRHIEHARDEADQRSAAADAEERGDDREAHRQQRPEGDEEDDHRGRDADELAREVRLCREDEAAQLDLQARDIDLVTEVLDRARVVGVLLVPAVGEVDLGVGDGAVLGDLVRVARLVGADDPDALDVVLDAREERLHPFADGGIVDPLLGAEHRLPEEAGALFHALFVQEVDGRLALRSGEPELSPILAREEEGRRPQGDEQPDPSQYDEPAPSIAECRDLLHHLSLRLDCGSRSRGSTRVVARDPVCPDTITRAGPATGMRAGVSSSPH